MPRETLLIRVHEELAKEIAEFAGWRTAMTYSATKREHASVRTSAGVFDVSHMTRTSISGERAAEFLSYLLTVNAKRMKVGRMKYCLILNEKGGIIDDVTVARLSENEFLLTSNAITDERVRSWLSEHTTSGVELSDVTENSVQLAVQGPRAFELVGELMGRNVGSMRWFSVEVLEYRDKRALLSRSGYTGEDGFEITLLDASIEEAELLWREVLKLGAEPCGLATRDILRLEASYPLSRTDFDETMNPYETRLEWTLDLDDHEFVGKDALLKERNISRLLVGLLMLSPGIPRRGMEVSVEGELAGKVTSGCLSYSLNKGIALCHVKPELFEDGRAAKVNVRGELREAVLRASPFVEHRFLR